MMQRLSGYPLVAFAVPMWGLARLLFYLTSLVHYHHNADPRTLQMGGKCHRRIVLSNASHAIVETLGRLGVNCILVSDIAAHMLGSASVPKDLKVVIIPSAEGSLTKENAAAMLVEDSPVMFRIRHRKDRTSVLSYFDSVVKPPKKTWCDIELITVRNPPPPEYSVEYVVQIDGLPVGSMLPLVIDKLRTLLVAYNMNNCNLSTSNIIYKRFKKLLTKSSINWIHGHESFRQEALRHLARASLLFPELSPQLSKLIHDCRKASFMHQGCSTPLGGAVSLSLPSTNEKHGELDMLDNSTESLPSAKTTSERWHEIENQNQKSSHSPSKADILCLIATRVVEVVRQTGADCALFGSLACYLYGNKRSPNDIDLIVFPAVGRPVDAEIVKRNIADHDPTHFRLEAPRDPTATYRVLYYVVDQGLAPSNTFHKNKCKIDVLVPGLLHLPSLSGDNIKRRSGLPVIPFPLLLLQKLQGWDDHIHMEQLYKFEKHVTDAADVRCLLKLEHVVSLRYAQPWDNPALFSREFMQLSRQRILDFCDTYPESAVDWSHLGFATLY